MMQLSGISLPGEVVESGYADLSGSSAATPYLDRYIDLSAAYDPDKYYPIILTMGASYCGASVSGGWVGCQAYWEDFANSRIHMHCRCSASSSGADHRFFYEIRKIPTGWRLYQDTHDVAVASNTSTAADYAITLSSSLRSVEMAHLVQALGLYTPIYDYVTKASAVIYGGGVRLDTVDSAYLSVVGSTGGTFRIPVIILH